MCRLLPIALLPVALLLTNGDVVSAQVIQLPTFHQFSVGTTVLVPDGGSAYLGGVDYARYGSSRRGPFNRSSSSSVGSAGVSVHATIIDHEELDRAVLAEAARKRGASVDVLGRDIVTGEMRTGSQDDRPAYAAAGPISREEAIRRKAAYLSQHVGRAVAIR